MKAYKTINLSFEKRMVVSYSSILCIICCFVILSPAFSQEDNQSRHHDFKKHSHSYIYDKNGQLVFQDSGFLWNWDKIEYQQGNIDSLFKDLSYKLKNLNEQFNDYDIDSIDNFKWYWPADSTAYAVHNFNNFDHYFDQKIDFEKYFPDEDFWEELKEKNDHFLKKFSDYQKEHKKLIEKYFYKEYQE